MPTDHPLTLDGSPLTIAQVVSVARDGGKIALDAKVTQRLNAMRAKLEALTTDGNAYYGINTGFGSLARTRIDSEKLRELQANLIRSHAAGVGEPLAEDIVRAMMLLLAASLSRGHSGVRPVVVETIIAWLNAGVTPVVPSLGSVGASGDLAPLAHAVLAMMGEAPTMEGRTPQDAGIEPLTLEAKEGLALINGTHLMAACAALILDDYDRLWNAAIIANAMSIDAFRASDSYLDPRVHAARNNTRTGTEAANLQLLLKGSEILPSHRTDDPRVQDPYSFRCAPYVLGAANDAANYVYEATIRELGAVTDNPLLFENGGTLEVVSAGNFHGMPIALPLDTLAIAITHIAGISERRVFAILAASDPETHLLPYLSHGPGLHSGLMIAQYTSAALVNEIAGLASPASVINLPTSAGIEDYNSFGPRAASKAARSLELTEMVVAIEIICAAEGVEFHRPLRSGPAVEEAIRRVREVVPPFAADRSPAPAIEAVTALIRSNAFGDIQDFAPSPAGGE
ncbi:MAG: histidine ammonia-lyase [Phycisphaera sp.]|nr:MAG: histidine ammonia-lyase [Phycisphaera sp.]